MILLLVATTASAVSPPCADVGVLVTAAWRAYQDADLRAARSLANSAASALSCQPRVVSNTELLELFWLDAHVALANDDALAIDQAIQRAVAAQHTEEGRPGRMVGPRLRQLWNRVREDQTQNLLTISARGEGQAWVDGRNVEVGELLQVAPGLHLIQSQHPAGLRSRVRLLEHDFEVEVRAPPAPDETTEAATTLQPEAAETSKRRKRRKRRKEDRKRESAP